MPAFEITGTANFSDILSKLQNLQSSLGNIRAPTITPKVEVPNNFAGGLVSQFSGQKGNFAAVGREMGQSLTMGMTQQFGMAGGVASSFATALGPIGIAAGVAGAAVIGLGAASTQAAMAWEDMKTSIGRTTGLKGNDLESLMSQLQDLRQEFGITAQAASDMVEQAGSIGVGQSKLSAGDMSGYKQEILDFTKATAILQGAWGMSAEATAQGVGKMGSVTLGQWNVMRKARGQEEMSWAEYAYTVGGQVDNLANAMGSSEEEIVTAMRNSSGAIAKWAPSEESYGKWQAMASFLIDTGASAGEAGTQIERMAQKMDQNSDGVAKLMGIDQATLTTKLKTDFMGTVQELGKTIASMPASQRPDTAKMFGLEGKVLIDKVIADVEAGTGKLQSAFDLALSPGNVAKGYEDVADNASKAFDRIGQAAQVSLEKIGGQLLPFVTSFANSIADAWVGANEAGSQLFAGAQKLLSGNAGLGVDVSETGLLGQLGYGGEWEIGWDGIHRKAADAIGEGAKEGTQTGMEAGSKAAQDQVGADLKQTAEEAAKAFAEVNDAYIKAHPGGMSLVDGKIIGGADHTSTYLKPGTQSGFATLLAGYSAQHFSGESIASSGFWNIFDNSGKVVAEKVLDLDAWKEQMQPIVLDIEKYFDTAGDSISGTLRSALEDGVIEPLSEKPALEGLIKQLNEMEKQYPIEFEAAGLPELRKDIEDSLKGIKIDLDKGELETNFGIWLSERMDLYQDIFDITTKHGAPVMSYESEQRSFWDKLMASSDPDRMNTLIGYIEKAASASSTFQDIEILPAIIEEIAAKEPELLQETATRNMLIAAQEKYGDQVRFSGETFTVLDANGKVLAETHLRTSQYANIANSGLTKLAERVAPAASAVDDLASAAKSAASALNGIHYSGYSPSTSYSSIGSTGYGLGTTYYSGANLTAASTTSLASHYINSSNFNGLLMNGIPKLAKGGMVTREGLVWAGEGGQELVIPLTDLKGLWSESAATAQKGSIGWYLNDQWFQDLAPTVSSAASYQWSKFPNVPSVMESNTDAIQRAWLSEDQKSTKDVYSGVIRQKQLDSIGNSLVTPWYAQGETSQPDWWLDAITALSGSYASEWSKSKGGNVSDLVSSANTSGVASVAKADVTTIKDIWGGIYGESFTEGCISTNAPDPSLVYTPSAKAISDYAYKQAQSDAAAWSYLYGESFTEGCIPTVQPDSTLKYTASESIKAEAARAMGGYWSTPITSTEDSSRITGTLDRIAENTEATENEVSLLKTTMSNSIFSSGSILTNGGIFNTLSGGTQTFATSQGDELVVGKSKEGYVVTYDPRTDTCEGLSFNPPDPSLKTTDRFYLGITAGNLPTQSYEEGYGWGGRVGWTDDVSLQQEQAAALSVMQEQQQKSTAGIQTIATTEEKLLSVTQQIEAQGGTPVIVVTGNGSTGGSSGTGALVVGGSGGSSWFSAASSRYGSTFNDWISGGAAGVGTGSDPAWFTAALNAALGSGYVGSVVGNRNNATIINTGQYTANRVESSGGSYGGWVPAFATEAFVPAPMLAMVGDKPGGEYVVGASRFESVVAKINSSPSISISSPITIQGNGNADELSAVLDRRNRELMENITELIATAAKGR